jgi:hypothetical protein
MRRIFGKPQQFDPLGTRLDRAGKAMLARLVAQISTVLAHTWQYRITHTKSECGNGKTSKGDVLGEFAKIIGNRITIEL